MISNLTKAIVERGGAVHFLKIPAEHTMGLGICNPSIYKDGDELLVNLRNVEYVLYHGEKEQKFPTRWGPLAYIHPEDDARLKTINFLCKLDPNTFDVATFSKVDTTSLDVTPIWTFVGLEDARVVRWDNKLYFSGVRRDTTTNGEGRMELSEIENNKEISRVRINPPVPSYCEKNWMPILDMPYHYVKWCNPTEVVKANIENGTSERVFLVDSNYHPTRDARGGSQVIPYKGYRVALIHEVELYKSEGGFKDAQYYHRFLVWDKNWNIVAASEDFKFFTSNIEFSCGITEHNGELLVSVGLQDNAAYLIRIPGDYFDELIGISDKLSEFPHVYYVSHENFTERQTKLNSELIKLGIKFTPIIANKSQDEGSIVTGKYVDNLDKYAKYVVLSHLRAIKHWYNNTNDEYGIFAEDDISFETVKYWNFKWIDFVNSLPKDWDCIQLCRMREFETEVNFRRREWNDWSAAAYLITRKYAKILIDTYYPNNTFNLDIGETNLMPISENIIYKLGNTYSFPLLIERINTKSTHNLKPDCKTPPELMRYIDIWHNSSSEFILNWWKSIRPNKLNQIHPLLRQTVFNPYDGLANLELGEYYFSQQHYAPALTYFLKVADYCNDEDLQYEALIKVARCLGRLGRRPASEETAFLNAITFQPQRPEAYLFISHYYEWYKKWTEMYNFAAIGYSNKNNKKTTVTNIDYNGDHIFLYQLALASNHLGRIEESRRWFNKLAEEHPGALVGHYRNVTQEAISILGKARPWTMKYYASIHDKLRFKFNDSESIKANYAQVFQDLFVLSILNGKKDGTYLEIGSGDPFINNNTALLEKQYNWTGLSVEIKEADVMKFKAERKNSVLKADALTLNYKDLLKEHKFPTNIDYLQVDCEPPKTTYEILTKIPFDEYKFAVITFEHDNYATLEKIYKKKSREFLKSKGYELLVANVGRNNVDDFEDWWIHPDLVNPEIKEIMRDDNDLVKNMFEYMLTPSNKTLVNKPATKVFNWGSFPDVQQVDYEIFQKRCYEWFFEVKEDDVVVDIGASVGPFTYSILPKNPKVVFCLEPDTNLFPTLVYNIGDSDKVICINKAIASSDNEITSYNSFSEKITDADKIIFGDFIRQYNIEKIDFLKIDCEGGEYDVFNEENFDWIMNNVKKIAGEFHFNNPDTVEKFIKFRDTYLNIFADYKITTWLGEDIKSELWNEDFIEKRKIVNIYINNE